MYFFQFSFSLFALVSLLTNKFIPALTNAVTVGIIIVADSPCDDWELYKDEKCLKIFNVGLQTYEDAKKTCIQNDVGTTLLSIHSLEEQNFLSNLLFNTLKVIDNIWIDAKNTGNIFKWADGSDLSFTNWAVGSPRNETGYECVQMTSDVSSKGKWVNEPCGKRNLVVCQKMQIWSISHLQKALMDARKELKDYIDITDKKLNNLQQNPVPIGFVYVQLPNQSEPNSLWPTVKWQDVTSAYAGVFFRAAGGNSGKFGEIQLEDSPKLTDVWDDGHGFDIDGNVKIQPGVWSKRVLIGHNSVPYMGLKFLVSSAEVRPRNIAIRIWKRTN